MRDLGLEKGRTLRTSELRELMDRGDVRVGLFVSFRRGFARVELLVPGRTLTVTVVDPAPHLEPGQEE
jgi:hypothetical protein